jgi:MFS superfamily sulfate permease-like transporter
MKTNATVTLATVSLLVSSVVNSVIKINPNITPSEVAVSLGLFAGITTILISLLRLGILVDFIPGMSLPAVYYSKYNQSYTQNLLLLAI